MTGSYVPKPEWLTLEWHHAMVAAGQLCLQRCSDCGTWRHPPRRRCAACWSAASSFEPVSGRGRVATFAVSHRSLDPAWQEAAPFVTLVVELEEGPRVLATTDLPRDEVVIGAPVTVGIEARSEDFVQLHAGAADRAAAAPQSG